jgi:hypothetical protein
LGVQFDSFDSWGGNSMNANHDSWPRALRLAALTAAFSTVLFAPAFVVNLSSAAFSYALFSSTLVRAAEVSFDLPESIECRDVTPPGFAAADYLKVIEGKLRISARVTSGVESEIVDFEYVIHSPDKRIRFQDYLPNTTLESAVADD